MCAERKKSQHDICQTSKRKKYNVRHNFDCSQSENPQDLSTYDNTQINANKYLHKRDIAKKKKKKTEKWIWLAGKRKNEQDICLTSKRKKYTARHNYECNQSENTQIDNSKCLYKRDIAKRNNLKAKERKCQRQKNIHKICVSKRNFIKKSHVSSILMKQNLANALKSYAMSNLCTKYKILQKAKRINVNQKSNTLTQCLHVFNQKTSSDMLNMNKAAGNF